MGGGSKDCCWNVITSAFDISLQGSEKDFTTINSSPVLSLTRANTIYFIPWCDIALHVKFVKWWTVKTHVHLFSAARYSKFQRTEFNVCVRGLTLCFPVFAYSAMCNNTGYCVISSFRFVVTKFTVHCLSAAVVNFND